MKSANKIHQHTKHPVSTKPPKKGYLTKFNAAHKKMLGKNVRHGK